MEKKPCEKNCKGQILSKTKGVYCDHIEKELPQLDRSSIRAHNVSYIDSFWKPLIEGTPRLSEKEITRQLYDFGLGVYEVELLLARFLEDKRLEALAKEQGWVSTRSASYHLKETIKKLRKGGFKFK